LAKGIGAQIEKSQQGGRPVFTPTAALADSQESDGRDDPDSKRDEVLLSEGLE
jgi:hypothetical protein